MAFITPHKHEAIVFDSSKDILLRKICISLKLGYLREKYFKLKTLLERHLFLSQIAFHTLGGKQSKKVSKVKAYLEEKLKNAKHETSSNQTFQNLFIGDLEFGNCRHVNLLYRYLADYMGLKTKIVVGKVIENDQSMLHLWCIAILKKESVIIDPYNFPYVVFKKEKLSLLSRIFKRCYGLNWSRVLDS